MCEQKHLIIRKKRSLPLAFSVSKSLIVFSFLKQSQPIHFSLQVIIALEKDQRDALHPFPIGLRNLLSVC